MKAVEKGMTTNNAYIHDSRMKKAVHIAQHTREERKKNNVIERTQFFTHTPATLHTHSGRDRQRCSS